MAKILLFALLLAACGEPASDPIPVIDVDMGADVGTADDVGGEDVADVAAPVEPTLRLLVEDVPTGELSEGDHALWGAKIVVRVEDLVPGAAVELSATMHTYSTTASFLADSDGTVDTGRDAPTAGDWTEADADALTWSMRSDNPGYGGSLDDLTIHVEVAVDDVVLSGMVTRSFSPAVQVVSVDDATLDAALYLPEGDGPHPVVLTFGGSEGGSGGAELYAGQIVRLGFGAMPLAYFASENTPEELDQIPLEYFERALQWLQARDDVSKIAVYGGSRGGELALLLGATYPELVSAVIAAAPSGLLWGSVSFAETAAWSLDAEPLPYVGSHGGMPDCVDDVCAYTPAFRTDIDNAPPDEIVAATTLVENIAGPVLLYAGADDELWPACELAEISWARLTTSGHTDVHDNVNLCIPDAGHGIAEPGWSTQDSDVSGGSFFGSRLRVGGTQAGNGRAGRIAQDAIRDFLRAWAAR